MNRTAAFRAWRFTATAPSALVDEKGAQSVRGQKVSGEFFDVLGIKPILGRGFARTDEQAGGGPGGLKVVVSYAFWRNHFNRATM